MQLNSATDIPTISNRTNFVIFELPVAINYADILPKSYRIQPDNNAISIDAIRAISELVQSKQTANFNVVIEDADLMTTAAANAFLKLLEEPNDLIHYIFLTRKLSQLLPTVRSRAQCYFLPAKTHILDAPDIDPAIMSLAKRYLSANAQDLPKLADEIAKDKDDARGKALKVVDAAIQLMYKSYFKVGDERFLIKLDQLLATQAALSNNGHIKLQLVANML